MKKNRLKSLVDSLCSKKQERIDRLIAGIIRTRQQRNDIQHKLDMLQTKYDNLRVKHDALRKDMFDMGNGTGNVNVAKTD